MSNADFGRTMARLPDDGLVRIVASGEGYEPDAIAAAKAELERRGSSRTIVDIQNDDTQAQIDRRSQPLSGAGYILFFIFGPAIWTWIAVIVLAVRGYHRQSRNALVAVLCGILFNLIIALAIAYLL